MNYFDKIYSNYLDNKMGHAFLIETNDFDLCFLDALKFVKKINCPYSYKDICEEKCNICYQIDNESLISLMVIEPIGQTITKEQVSTIIKRFIKDSLSTKFNVYIIKNIEKLNLSAANTILKFLEEPSGNVVGIFLTSNKQNVLPTIKSRCQLGVINYDKMVKLTEEDENIKLVAIKYITEILTKKSNILLNKTLLANYIEDRKNIEKIFYFILDYLYERKNTIPNIGKILLITKKTIENMTFNVNILLALDNYIIEVNKEQ